MTAMVEETLCLGGDPRGCAEFGMLGGELAKLNHPACPDVDWVRVEQLAITLFREHGVELQSAAAFALACAQRRGLEGMGEGVRLINRLLARDRLWPPALAARLDILAWLFTHLQPLLRRQAFTAAQMPEIERLDEGLRQLSNRLGAQAQAPLVPLQALRKQLHNALQGSMHDIIPATQAYSPAVVVLKLDAVEAGPRAARKTRWPWVVVLLILLGAMFWWWAKERWIAEDAPIHLDNLVLFPPGRAELKPEATKMLVNSLVDIKAQPGWLIVITGHSDTSGNPERNLELSRKRAEAVKAWMQRMGDIPESCFVVQGKGAGQPIADNDTERGRRANRRVDIRLMPSEGACEPTSN